MQYIYLTALALLGLCMLIFPRQLWKISNFLWTQKGDPSNLYTSLMRISGAAFLVLALILFMPAAVARSSGSRVRFPVMLTRLMLIGFYPFGSDEGPIPPPSSPCMYPDAQMRKRIDVRLCGYVLGWHRSPAFSMAG